MSSSKGSGDGAAKPELVYGIDIAGADVEYFELGTGQTLADVLGDRGVPYATTLEAAAESKSVFDVRRMKAGRRYCLVTRPGGNENEKRVTNFVYEIDPVNYVAFDLENPVKVYTGARPVETTPRTVRGEIQSSLWATCAEREMDVSLILDLSEIFAWTVDFHHLQKGDGFKIIYEEKYVDNESIGAGPVLAARFTRGDRRFDAFLFEQDGKKQYFDENGDSLKSAFLRAPIKFARISSRFTHKRFHPILKTYRKHLGIDYAAPAGTPVMTVGNGTIHQVGRGRAEGKYVKVKHSNRHMTQYMHLSRVPKGIRAGKKVMQGDIVGYVGSTGLATGPHLDFRFFENGRPVDFAKIAAPRARGVDEKNKALFFRKIADLAAQLEEENDDRVASIQTRP